MRARAGVTVDGPTTRMTPFDVKSVDTPSRHGLGALQRQHLYRLRTRQRLQSGDGPNRRLSTPSRAADQRERTMIPSGTAVSGSGPSLHGLASEFFVIPAEAGSRVEVTDKATGAASRGGLEFLPGTWLANVGL